LEDSQLISLPESTRRVLTGFIESAKRAFGDDLRSIVLFGSAAEGKMRPTSDVNVMLLLTQFDRTKADQMREPLSVAGAAIRLEAMFLLEGELQGATRAFAVKFADIARRRQILYGRDPFQAVTISRADSIIRLKQTLLNMALRLRESYISRGMREEQLVATIAEAAGPLRSCAATLLDLEGAPAPSPKEALERVAASAPDSERISRLSEARENQSLPAGTAAETLFYLIELSSAMWLRASALL
jgi:hypothetical protein